VLLEAPQRFFEAYLVATQPDSTARHHPRQPSHEGGVQAFASLSDLLPAERRGNLRISMWRPAPPWVI
jgi:hypothetical protein